MLNIDIDDILFMDKTLYENPDISEIEIECQCGKILNFNRNTPVINKCDCGFKVYEFHDDDLEISFDDLKGRIKNIAIQNSLSL